MCIIIVFRAYQANVPTEMTEKEFWTKYVQSAYFNRDRGGTGNEDGAGAGQGGRAGGAGRRRGAAAASAMDSAGTDDMFLRLAAEEAEREAAQKESGVVAGAGVGDGGKKNGASAGERLAPGSVDPMVDLTSQWGDYHLREVSSSFTLRSVYLSFKPARSRCCLCPEAAQFNEHGAVSPADALSSSHPSASLPGKRTHGH